MSKFTDDLINFAEAYRNICEVEAGKTVVVGEVYNFYSNSFDYMIEHYDPEFKQKPVVSKVEHYAGTIEPIDLIEAQQLNFNRGNIIKYVSRAGKKDSERDDLQKALWYLEREIKNLD